MKKTVLATIACLVVCGLSACGNHDDSVYFYARFSINGSKYSLEKGYAGDGAAGLPAGNTVLSPGVDMFRIVASSIELDTPAAATDGYLSIEINSECTNAGTNANVTYRYRHPGKDGVYLAIAQTVVISELGPVGAGVAVGTFQVIVSNETLHETLSLQAGSFRVKRIAADTLPTSF